MTSPNMRQFYALKKKVGELEGRIQAIEGYGAAQVENFPDLDPIPTIEEAVTGPDMTGPSLYNFLEPKTAILLFDNGYDVEKVKAASDEDLENINGIGAATVKKIRKALEG